MKLTKKQIGIIVIASVLTLVLALGGVFGGSYLAFATKKRAMIILPGLFGSGLYDSETGDYAWDNFEGLDDISFATVMNAEGMNMTGIVGMIFSKVVLEALSGILAEDGIGEPDSLINKIGMNHDGTSIFPSIEPVPWSDDSRWKYGVINAQKEMWETLEARYGDLYEVQVFNYDFRKDTRHNALKLEEYINEMKYKEVVLLAHSNGGPVAATYLARSEENRKKVTKFVSYNAPLYGSFSAIGILEDVNGMIAGLKDTLSNIDLGSSAINTLLSSVADRIEIIFENQFLKLINMWTPYQLLPSYDLFSQEYEGEWAGYFLDGERMNFKSQEDLWDFYCTRPWAKVDGELRAPMADWVDFWDSMYVTLKDGSRVLSTTLVDTIYINGNGVRGGYQTYFVTDEGTGEVVLDHMVYTTKGDGTVLTASATAGYVEKDKIAYFEGYDHYALLYDFNGVAKEITFDAIDESFDTSFNLLENMWRKVIYGG